VFSALISLLSTRANLLKIRDMAQFACPVRVLRRRAGEREQGRETVGSEELVPGDVIEIDDGMVLPCDAVVTSGSVVVSSLTRTLPPPAVPPNRNAAGRLSVPPPRFPPYCCPYPCPYCTLPRCGAVFECGGRG
jgi:hypothetical protein